MPYKDKDKQAEFHKNEYTRHKDRYSERNKKRREERKAWFFEQFLDGKTCQKCVENDPICLDFHHIDPSQKEGTISRMVNEFRSKESIMEEIKKCVLVCSNCHRKIHAGKIVL